MSLAPKLAAGSIARYSVHVEGEDATAMSGAMEMRSDTKWHATLDVLVQFGERDAAGLTTATISLDRIRAGEEFDGQPFRYDSTEPPEKDPTNRVRPMIEALVGCRFELGLDANGTIVKASVPAELTRRHGPSVRWSARLLDEGEIRTLFGPIFTTGIAAAASGQAWTTQRDELFGSAGVTTTMTHTLGEARESIATISITGDSAMTPNPRIEPGVQRILRQSLTGTSRWDIGRGLLAEHESGRETQVQVQPDPNAFTISKTLVVQVRRMD